MPIAHRGKPVVQVVRGYFINDVDWATPDEITYAQDGALRMVRPDGTDDHVLLSVPGIYLAMPSWSPDGTRIAYVVEHPSTFEGQLFVANADGSDPVQITTTLSDYSFVSWQPSLVGSSGVVSRPRQADGGE
jgi:hypothetical protein